MTRPTLNARVRLTAVIAAAAILLAACGSTASSNPPAAAGNGVSLANFAFAPATLTVKAGTAVTWTNKDTTTHTVTADDGSFDSGHLSGSATFTFTFAKAGTFTYHCAIHSSMTATVTVQ